MSDQHLSPTSAGVGAVAGLQSDLDRAVGHVVAQPGPALGAARTRRIDAADDTPERGFDHDARTVVEHANDLMSWHERVARQRVEAKRDAAADRRQVARDDPGKV